MAASIAAAAPAAGTKAWLRATASLLRAELRGLAPMVGGLLVCALIVLYLARRFWGANLPLEGASHGILCQAVALAALIPMTAELLESDWRRGTARVFQAAPVRRHQLFLAKGAAAALLGVALFGALRILDQLVAGALMPPPEISQAVMEDTFNWPNFRIAAWALAWMGVTATGITASVFRHSLAATLLGLLLTIGPALLTGVAGASAMGLWFVPRGFNTAANLAFSAAAVLTPVLCLAVTYRLRGRSARSVLRRAMLGGLICTAIASGPFAAMLTYRLTGSDPTFDHPDAYVSSGCEVSPDGRQALLRISQPGHTNRIGDVTWVLDTETLEASLLPDVFRIHHPLLFFGWYQHGAFWTYDGKKLCVNGQSGWGDDYGESLLFDPVTDEVEDLPRKDYSRIGENAGWAIAPSRDPDDNFVGYHCSGPRGEQIDLESVHRPRIPRDANHLLLYESSDREVRLRNTSTGADRAVASLDGGESLAGVSLEGDWAIFVANRPHSGKTLVEVATGTRRPFEGQVSYWGGFEYPLLQHRSAHGGSWSLVTLDDEQQLDLAKPVNWLERLPKDRLIGGNSHGGVWVFALDGSLVKELRPSRDTEGAQ